jgi:hypothetical protein
MNAENAESVSAVERAKHISKKWASGRIQTHRQVFIGVVETTHENWDTVTSVHRKWAQGGPMDRITTTDHTHHIFPHKAPTTKLNPAPSALRPSKVKVTFFTTAKHEHWRSPVRKSNPNSQGWHFQVDLMNHAYEGLLLGMQAEGPTCWRPPQCCHTHWALQVPSRRKPKFPSMLLEYKLYTYWLTNQLISQSDRMTEAAFAVEVLTDHTDGGPCRAFRSLHRKVIQRLRSKWHHWTNALTREDMCCHLIGPV